MTTTERFWDKVYRGEGACWLWTGAVTATGYGAFRVGGRTVKAHRFAWELDHGPIPAGLHVCHACDTPLCVKHLFLGTDRANVADMVAKGRQAKGVARWNARLTPARVQEIRTRWQAGGVTQRQLAQEYGVHFVTIHDLLAGKTWVAA